jgi:hypothetical protein
MESARGQSGRGRLTQEFNLSGNDMPTVKEALDLNCRNCLALSSG